MNGSKVANDSSSILLSFTGYRDPYQRSIVEGQNSPGPVLSLLSIQKFDHIILFSTPKLTESTKATRVEVLRFSPDSTCEILETGLDDPSDLKKVLSSLRHHVREILKQNTESRLYVLLNPGTPQMQVAWILLGGSGELPASLLNLREAAHTADGQPHISAIDLSAPEFPAIVTNFEKLKISKKAPGLNHAREELGIIGADDRLARELEKAAMAAPFKYPIIIHGPTGTGKENTARLIHQLSGRAKEKFFVHNCAELPSTLVESILFGHKKGAFTDAREERKGLFELANKGTLFLDELGELPLEIQAKLLRVLSEGEVTPLGSGTPKTVDVRIVTATNRDLRIMVSKGSFREDLYQRLKTIEVKLPSLAQRKSDIPLLASAILTKLNLEHGTSKRLAPSSIEKLYHHNWPGNIRELENVIKRSFIFNGSENVIQMESIELETDASPNSITEDMPYPSPGFSLENFLSGLRTKYIIQAMEITNNNQSKAADLLGCSPQNINRLLKKINQN